MSGKGEIPGNEGDLEKVPPPAGIILLLINAMLDSKNFSCM